MLQWGTNSAEVQINDKTPKVDVDGADSEWHHYCITSSSSPAKFYYDGAYVGTLGTTPIKVGNLMSVGNFYKCANGQSTASGCRYHGHTVWDNIYFKDEEFTPQDISDLYNFVKPQA